MKKVLTTIMLTVTFALFSQFMTASEAVAADVYAFTENGVEYYICNKREYGNFYWAWLTGVKDGRRVDALKYNFGYNNRGAWYQLVNRNGYTIEEDYVVNNGRAQIVYDLVRQE